MDIFEAMDRAFRTHRASGRIDEALAIWRGRWLDLRDVESVETLISRCRGPRLGSRSEKDRIHVTLCVEASGEMRDPVAGLVLAWLFLPGLSGLLGSLATGAGVDREDIASDLLTGFWEAATHVDASSSHVARHLLRGARRRALRGLRASRVPRLSADTEIETAGSPDVLVEDRLRRAIDAGVLGPPQAELLLASRSSIALLAARHGMSLAAAQQARHRARKRLRAWLAAS